MVTPRSAEYPVKVSRGTASLAGATEKEERLGKLLELLEQKAEEMEVLSGEGDALAEPLRRSYLLLLGRGVVVLVEKAEEEGDASYLARLALPKLEEHLERFREQAARQGRGFEEMLAGCREAVERLRMLARNSRAQAGGPTLRRGKM